MLNVLKQVRSAFSLLNPDQVRKLAQRRLSIGLIATGSPGYAELEDFLLPSSLPEGVRTQLLPTLHCASDPQIPPHIDLVLYEPGIACPAGAFTYRRDDPLATVREILDAYDDLWLPLARSYPIFRKPVVERIVLAVSRENAVFAVASALPNVVPNLLELPWAFGEFASDTAFITANQVRMALLIAAACGAEVGFMRQKAEVLSIAAGAFGWRALARELAGKIPLGGGLIPKGAIAFAGTFVIGKGLEHFHHGNVPYTPQQREEVYVQAYERGKDVAEGFTKQSG